MEKEKESKVRMGTIAPWSWGPPWDGKSEPTPILQSPPVSSKIAEELGRALEKVGISSFDLRLFRGLRTVTRVCER